MRGSFRPPRVSATTARTDSLTRRIRSLIGALRYVVGGHERPVRAHELPLLPGEPGLRAGRQFLGLAGLTRGKRRREGAALPEVVVVDLRDGCPEPVLQLGLRRLHVLALPLERARLGEVQLDRENRDEAGPRAYDSSAAAAAPADTGSSSDVRSTSRVS